MYLALAVGQTTLDGSGSSGMKQIYNYQTNDTVVTLVFTDGTTYKMNAEDAKPIIDRFDQCLIAQTQAQPEEARSKEDDNLHSEEK